MLNQTDFRKYDSNQLTTQEKMIDSESHMNQVGVKYKSAL